VQSSVQQICQQTKKNASHFCASLVKLMSYISGSQPFLAHGTLESENNLAAHSCLKRFLKQLKNK
jgi:hypothetical protein